MKRFQFIAATRAAIAEPFSGQLGQPTSLDHFDAMVHTDDGWIFPGEERAVNVFLPMRAPGLHPLET